MEYERRKSTGRGGFFFRTIALAPLAAAAVVACLCVGDVRADDAVAATRPAPPPPFDLARLTPLAHGRPRLFLTPDRLASLRASIATTHGAIWANVRAQADAIAAVAPPAAPADDKDWEQSWQRPVGNAMPTLAIAFRLSGDRRYLDALDAYARASCGYPTWGGPGIDGIDLAAGHQLLGLAIAYDWCRDDLPAATRTMIRETLLRRGRVMYDAAASHKIHWTTAYLQNHLWIASTGLTAAALALADEPDAQADVARWLGFTSDAMRHTFDALGDDGASHEGVAYWEYGVEHLLEYATLARDATGEDVYATTPWLKATARYPMYLSVPRDAWTPTSSIVDLADCPRLHWYGPEHIERALAAAYRDGHAQWFAQQIDEAGVSKPNAPWLNLIWYDPGVTPLPPTDLPTLHHFADIGIVSARSDWSGHESLVVFKSGPAIGHAALARFDYDVGASHAQPDANHFVIFAGGQWLIRDDGYRTKMTASHNTLLVDGHGQFGEGKMWFDYLPALRAKSEPRVTEATSTPALDRISGDATTAYPAALGLARFRRHLLFVKPDALIVIDDVASDHDSDLELRFHPEASAGTRDGDAMTIPSGGGVTLRVDLLTPRDVTLDAETIATPGRGGEKPTDLFTLRLRRHASAWRNATAFTWTTTGGDAPRVTLDGAGGDRWTFRVAGHEPVTFDWDAPTTSPSTRP